MGSAIQTTGVVREIPLNKLVPSQINVRQTGPDANVEELAASILAHGILQTLTVRPERDGDNRATGKYEVIAGGRRLAALKLLAARKEIAKTAPIACLVREDGSARELSLVENVQRVNLHPADQFDAFRALREKDGLGAEEIAARFGVTARIVRERLKLAAVSPTLMAKYRAGELALDQIMAFAVMDDPARQEEVWENLSYDTSPHAIRRALLSGHVPAGDKRVLFVGLGAYEAAGGAVLRDLFAEDDGGYLTDPGLLDRLARQKLENVAETVGAEGWKWVEGALDFPHAHGMRRIYPQDIALSEEDAAKLVAIEAELDRLGAECEADEGDDPAREAKMAELNAAYEAIDAKGRVFEPGDVARAGAIVSIGYEGEISIVRELVLPEDVSDSASAEQAANAGDATEAEAPDDGMHLPDRLATELRAQQTMALRDRLGSLPDAAQIVLTHALASEAFFFGDHRQSPLDVAATSLSLEHHAPGIGEGVAARSIATRHEAWAARLPKESAELWGFLVAMASGERIALLAHCVSLLVNVVHGHDRHLAATRLAALTGLEMGQYWKPTAENNFTRIPKALILEAVKEGVSAEAAERLRTAKKADMAKAAEEWLAATTWLPVLLRGQPRSSGNGERAAAAE